MNSIFKLRLHVNYHYVGVWKKKFCQMAISEFEYIISGALALRSHIMSDHLEMI